MNLNNVLWGETIIKIKEFEIISNPITLNFCGMEENVDITHKN